MLDLGALANIGGKIIDRVWPDPVERDAAKLKLFELQQSGELAAMAAETELAKGQIEVNKIEAGSDSMFKSGWRPAVGWVCVSGLAYQLVVQPLLSWSTNNLFSWAAAPTLELETLMTLLFGMLGLGAFRTVEKVKAA